MNCIKLALFGAFLACSTTHMVAAQTPDDTTSGGNVYTRKTIIETSNTTPTNATSTSEVVEQRGFAGIKQANVFAPKYKERLNTYLEQIQMGITKGWLTKEQADHFTGEVERLRKVEADAAAQGYPKPLVDDLDKQLTQMNIDFTKAANPQPVPPAATSAPAPTASPTPSAVPVQQSISTKPAVKATTLKKSPLKKAVAKKASKK